MSVKLGDSILESVKKLVNVEGDEYFDTDLIIHINTVFSKLTQMGIGPSKGFAIEDNQSTWDEFTDNLEIMNMVKSYMALQVKLLFDTSTASSYVIELMKEQSSEIEWRLNVACDKGGDSNA